MMPLRRFAALALVAGSAACVTSPKPAERPPAPPPAARPAPPPAPAPVVSNWMDVPQTPGDWRYVPTASGSEARFGEAASEPRFTLRCVRSARSVELLRWGPTPAAAPLTVRTETATRAVAGSALTDTPGLRAVLAASDPLLDAMAFSKGRFAVEAAGAPSLYLPSWPEVTRVIEDCR